MIGERKVTSSADDWSIGGRVDLMYGADAPFTFARGFDDNISESAGSDYRLAIPQAYLEMNAPIGTGLDVKIGHFYTLLGYEVVTAPDNFFYTHSYSMQYAEPFTHFGVLGSYKLNDWITTSAGAVRGWDNLSDSADGNLSFLGGITLAPTDSTTLVFSLISGNEGPKRNQTAYSIVLTQKLCGDFSYILQHDLGTSQGTGDTNAAQWYSINQYLLYKVNDTVSTGIRFEWFRDEDGVRVAGLRSGSAASSSSYYETSLGAQVKLTDSLTFRPEIRWDWQNHHSNVPSAFESGTDDSQVIAAGNVLISF